MFMGVHRFVQLLFGCEEKRNLQCDAIIWNKNTSSSASMLLVLFIAATAIFLAALLVMTSSKNLSQRLYDLKQDAVVSYHAMVSNAEDIIFSFSDRICEYNWNLCCLKNDQLLQPWTSVETYYKQNLRRFEANPRTNLFFLAVCLALFEQPLKVAVLTGGNRGIGIHVLEKLLICKITVVLGNWHCRAH